MNLTIFMFYLSVSVYSFLSSQISYKFPDMNGVNFSFLTKTSISLYFDHWTWLLNLRLHCNSGNNEVSHDAYWLINCCILGYSTFTVLWLDMNICSSSLIALERNAFPNFSVLIQPFYRAHVFLKLSNKLCIYFFGKPGFVYLAFWTTKVEILSSSLFISSYYAFLLSLLIRISSSFNL